MTRHYVVPGRIELVGKHVDYAGGRSLTCAVDLALTAQASRAREAVVRVHDIGRRGVVEVPLMAGIERTHGSARWSAYVVAVVRRFARDFPHARIGVDVRLSSTLPRSAGLSSSSALVVALATALADANDMEHEAVWRDAVPNAVARAEYFGAMETGAPYGPFAGDEGVGVRGGAQDHVAIVCAEEESVGQFAYLPARLERRVSWASEYALAIGVSGVKATKTGNARARYNRVADSTRSLVRAWNTATRRADVTLADALASGAGAADRLARMAENGTREFPAEYLVPRLAQFREETGSIVPGTGDALRDRDFDALGRLVDRSMEMADQGLGNQVPETLALVRSARERGAVAASAFGAGFGGAVWAMVRADGSAAFLDEWRAAYVAAYPERAEDARWVVTRPGGPAREVTASGARA